MTYQHKSGTTLVEMILYIGIVTLISSSMVGLYIQIIKLRSQATAIQEVNDSVRIAATKIGYEIRQAHTILGVGTSLKLDMVDTTRNPTVFELNNGRIQMTVGASVAYITSNLVNINTFNLTNLSSGDTLTQNVRFTISGSYLGNNASITSSSEIRSK